MRENVDNVIIGGGVYGLHIATELANRVEGSEVLLLEREEDFFTRASGKNHGRLHHGYQYPLSQQTARECHENYLRFARDFEHCVDQGSGAYYAVHAESLVSTDEYVAFCDRVGLALERAEELPSGVFGDDVDAVFQVEETVFSIDAVRQEVVSQFEASSAEVLFSTDVSTVAADEDCIAVSTSEGVIYAKNVFNCGYSGIRKLHERSGIVPVGIGMQDTILFKVALPEELEGTSLTTIFGPFSTAVVNREDNSTHVLAHVEHSKRENQGYDEVRDGLSEQVVMDRFQRTVQDSVGFLPVLQDAEYRGYTVEAKSFLVDGSLDVERKVILLPDWDGIDGYNVILGGKMNNFYDAGSFAVNRVAEH